MSAASEPAPRMTSPSAARHTLFLPVLVLMIGLGLNSVYQVMALEDQLDAATRSVDDMDLKMKVAEYDRAKLHAIAAEVILLVPKNANARQIAQEMNLQQIEAMPKDSVLTTTPDSIDERGRIAPPNATTNAPPK